MSKFVPERFLQFLALTLTCTLALSGCATRTPVPAASRPFSFEHDTFAYANELTWVYSFDKNGKWSANRREPKPDYTLHCFVVARSAQQFFRNARFEAALPRTNEETYRKLIEEVVDKDPRHIIRADKKVVIPGYANLREFSIDYEHLLKDECGSFWRSYFQRGNWRMVFPFTRRHQQTVAGQLHEKTKGGQPVVVHIVQFPELSINHAVVLYDASMTEGDVRFAVYDPNYPEQPSELRFDRLTRTFHFPQNTYFAGGEVNVYEIYKSWFF